MLTTSPFEATQMPRPSPTLTPHRRNHLLHADQSNSNSSTKRTTNTIGSETHLILNGRPFPWTTSEVILGLIPCQLMFLHSHVLKMHDIFVKIPGNGMPSM
jgi:hypothetical protein